MVASGQLSRQAAESDAGRGARLHEFGGGVAGEVVDAHVLHSALRRGGLGENCPHRWRLRQRLPEQRNRLRGAPPHLHARCCCQAAARAACACMCAGSGGLTASAWCTSRSACMWGGRTASARCTTRSTELPTGPRMWRRSAGASSAAAGMPSTESTTSPMCSPAASAADPLMVATTARPPPITTSPIRMPTPACMRARRPCACPHLHACTAPRSHVCTCRTTLPVTAHCLRALLHTAPPVTTLLHLSPHCSTCHHTLLHLSPHTAPPVHSQLLRHRSSHHRAPTVALVPLRACSAHNSACMHGSRTRASGAQCHACERGVPTA
jgi:hypothetical protein